MNTKVIPISLALLNLACLPFVVNVRMLYHLAFTLIFLAFHNVPPLLHCVLLITTVFVQVYLLEISFLVNLTLLLNHTLISLRLFSYYRDVLAVKVNHLLTSQQLPQYITPTRQITSHSPWINKVSAKSLYYSTLLFIEGTPETAQLITKSLIFDLVSRNVVKFGICMADTLHSKGWQTFFPHGYWMGGYHQDVLEQYIQKLEVKNRGLNGKLARNVIVIDQLVCNSSTIPDSLGQFVERLHKTNTLLIVTTNNFSSPSYSYTNFEAKVDMLLSDNYPSTRFSNLLGFTKIDSKVPAFIYHGGYYEPGGFIEAVPAWDLSPLRIEHSEIESPQNETRLQTQAQEQTAPPQKPSSTTKQYQESSDTDDEPGSMKTKRIKPDLEAMTQTSRGEFIRSKEHHRRTRKMNQLNIQQFAKMRPKIPLTFSN